MAYIYAIGNAENKSSQLKFLWISARLQKIFNEN